LKKDKTQDRFGSGTQTGRTIYILNIKQYICDIVKLTLSIWLSYAATNTVNTR